MLCFKYRRLLTHSMTIRIRPTGCYDTIKPRFWLRYHEAPVTDTSIASSCWANTRRGCHRAVPHSFLKGLETSSRFLFRQRGCFHFREYEHSCAFPFSFILNGLRFLSWNGHILLAILRESSNIPRELSSGKFLLIKFRSPKNFGSDDCLNRQESFSDFVLKK